MSERENWLSIKEPRRFCEAVMARFESRERQLKASRLHNSAQAAWGAYYRRDKRGAALEFAGPKGEIVSIEPSVFRQKVQSRIALIAVTPQDVEAIAENTDPDSQAQCKLGVGLVRHYQSEHHLGQMRLEAYEQAAICAETYLHAPWDASKGEPAIAAADGMSALPGGEFSFSLRSIYDVWIDKTGDNPRNPRACIGRERMNRWDSITRWPKHEEALRKAAPYVDCMGGWGYDDATRQQSDSDLDDTIAVYFVYALPSPSLPDGLQAVILDEMTMLEEPSALGYARCPLFPLVLSRTMFNGDGYSNHFGGLEVAQARGALISTWLSNIRAYGLMRMLVPRKANVSRAQIQNGLAAIEYDHVDGDGNQLPDPRAWMLSAPTSSPEMFTAEAQLAQLQDAIQGDSPVARGDTSATKGDSGAKVAALFSASQQVAAPDVRALFAWEQDVFNHILQTLQRYATTERLVVIAGSAHQHTAERFSAERIRRVRRIKVRQPDPARDSFAGRQAMAEILKGAQDLAERQMLSALMTTGNADVLTDSTESARLVIERENEALRNANGPVPEALKTDQHREHFAKHTADLNSDNVRGNPDLRARYEQHLAQHIARLTPMHPEYAGDDVLAMTGQQPLAPPTTPPGMGVPGQPQGPRKGGDGGGGGKGAQQPSEPPDGGSKPGQAGMPKDPTSGQRMPGAPPPPPVTGG